MFLMHNEGKFSLFLDCWSWTRLCDHLQRSPWHSEFVEGPVYLYKNSFLKLHFSVSNLICLQCLEVHLILWKTPMSRKQRWHSRRSQAEEKFQEWAGKPNLKFIWDKHSADLSLWSTTAIMCITTAPPMHCGVSWVCTIAPSCYDWHLVVRVMPT